MSRAFPFVACARRSTATIIGLVLAQSAIACAPSSAGEESDAPASTMPTSSEAPTEDAGAYADADADADADASSSVSSDPTIAWARYVIQAGAHVATVVPGADGNPRGGFVSGTGERTYELAFDPSAIYVIDDPVQPNDQLDWNKLPGLSDCGTLDLAVDGVMFGWRWRTDTAPPVLEVTAYANNAKAHLTAASPLVVLDADDLASRTPLRYRLWMDGGAYRFSIAGTIRGRNIAVTTELPRRCATTSPATLFVQWAAGLYFGGTSTAPSTITARIHEP